MPLGEILQGYISNRIFQIIVSTEPQLCRLLTEMLIIFICFFNVWKTLWLMKLNRFLNCRTSQSILYDNVLWKSLKESYNLQCFPNLLAKDYCSRNASNNISCVSWSISLKYCSTKLQMFEYSIKELGRGWRRERKVLTTTLRFSSWVNWMVMSKLR